MGDNETELNETSSEMDHKTHVGAAQETRTETVRKVTVVARDAAHSQRLFQSVFKDHLKVVRGRRKP